MSNINFLPVKELLEAAFIACLTRFITTNSFATHYLLIIINISSLCERVNNFIVTYVCFPQIEIYGPAILFNYLHLTFMLNHLHMEFE